MGTILAAYTDLHGHPDPSATPNAREPWLTAEHATAQERFAGAGEALGLGSVLGEVHEAAGDQHERQHEGKVTSSASRAIGVSMA